MNLSKRLPLLLTAALLTAAGACQKNDDPGITPDTPDTPAPCLASARTTRQLENAPATVYAVGGQYFLLEQNTIDTRLRPCNLPAGFRVDRLKVVVSGDVRATVSNDPGPCCTNDFVISRISR